MDLNFALNALLDHTDQRKQVEPVNLQMPATMLLLKVLRLNNHVQLDDFRQAEKATPIVNHVQQVSFKMTQGKHLANLVIKDPIVRREQTQLV